MPNPTFIGYLEDPYLEDPYMSGSALHAFGMQVNRVIADFQKPLGMQVNRQVQDDKALGMQAALNIQDDQAKGAQVNRITSVTKNNGMQANRIIDDFQQAKGFEIRRDKTFPHAHCEDLGYLGGAYLEGPYLGEGYCVSGPMQVSRIISNFPKANGMEVDRAVANQKAMGTQVKRVIADAKKSMGMQIARFRASNFGMQMRLVLYNTTNLRIMCDFPSRGTSGVNWTATSTAAGDFGVNNLNTDIVEQVWRSATGTTSVILTSDTEVVQGIPVDTAAVLNHNLTTSAGVVLEASNSATFSPVGFSITLTALKTNLYYIAPTFPTEQFRYWRFIITDPTNPNSFLQIGTIVFGTTVILQGECFTDVVARTPRHFADKVATEGFTNVSNDRALKTAIGLDFQRIAYNRGNYKNLKDLFELSRTSLKCLWVPDPQKVDRFTVFAKMTQMPAERHKNMGEDADFVEFGVEVDESL